MQMLLSHLTKLNHAASFPTVFTYAKAINATGFAVFLHTRGLWTLDYQIILDGPRKIP
jgi:hypothetical protein